MPNNNNNNENNNVEQGSFQNITNGLSNGKKLIGKRKHMKGAVDIAQKAIKVVVKMVKYAIKAIVNVLGPWLLLLLGIFLIWFVIYDEEYGSKGTEKDYQEQQTKYSNHIAKDDKGEYRNTNVSKANKILQSYYTVKSEDSYYVQLDNGDVVPGSSDEAKQLKDKYGREKMFYINPNMLWTLDTMLNNNKFIYPEQFLKPVAYDKESFKLKDLVDEHGNVQVESDEYKKEGDSYKKTGDKVKGIWDYGFASVLKYKKFQETKKISGTYNKMTYYNTKTGKVEWKDINESFTEDYEGYPKDVSLITDAVTPAGTITNKIRFDEQTMPVVLQPGTGAVASNSQDVVCGSETVDEYGWVEKTRYEKQMVKKTVPATKIVIDNVTGQEVEKEIEGKTKEVEVEEEVPVKYKEWDKTGNKITYDIKKRKSDDTKITQKIPQYDGEPDAKEITGNKYFFAYMQNYKTYVPKNVLDKFDYEARTGKDEEDVFNTPIGTGTAFVGGSSTVNFDMGNGATGGDYKRSLQYIQQAKAIGEKAGVDPYLIIAIIAKESSGNPDCDNGCAYGLMQYEYCSNSGHETIYYTDGSSESFNVNKGTLSNNVELQIKAGVAELQSKAKAVKGNPLATLCAYNFGEGGVKYMILHYLASQGKASMDMWGTSAGSSAINQYLESGDSGWLKERQWYHDEGHYKFPGAGGGTVDDLEKCLNFYKNLDGGQGPWMTIDGKTITINGSGAGMTTGSQATGSVSNANSSPSQLSDGGLGSWLKGCFNKIKAVMKKWYTDIKYSDDKFMFDGRLSGAESQNAVNLFFALQSNKRFSEVGDIKDEDWKLKYKELFKNPLGNGWGDNGTLPQVNPTDYFTNGEFTSPITGGSIIKKFGMNGSVVDKGIVISATEGTKAFSVANDGLVTDVGKNDEYGTYVTVEYSNDTQLIYGNLSEALVKKGDKIKKGDEVGKVGNTNTSSQNANGLYLELHHKGSVEDPTWIVSGLTGGTLMGNGGMPIPADASPLAKKVISIAKQYLGSPYAWGGKNPPTYVNGQWYCKEAGWDASNGTPLYATGFDCSGLVGWAVSQGAGVDIGWSTYDQVKHGTPISSADLKPGDIILYGGNTSPHHVVLYEGDMQIIEAPHTGAFIREKKITEFKGDWVYRRVLPDVK